MLSFVHHRWLITFLIVIALAAAAFAAVKGLRPAQKKDDGPVTLEFVPTDLTQAETRVIAQRLPLSGTLQPRDQAIVKAKVAGDVRLALVREGETVRAGQLLVQLDSLDLRAKLAEKQANLDAGRAQLAIAEKNRATNQALLKQGFISQNAYDNVESTMNIQKETVKSWDAQVAVAKNALADAQATAPIAGIVAKQHARTGEKVTIDSPLYTLVNLRQMELQAMVPAFDIAAVQLGAAVRFTVDGFEGKAFTGRVERINPTAEPGSRTVTVYITVPNPDLLLRGGSFASGSLELVASAPRPTLPLSAIRSENGQNFVWLIQAGKLARRAVVLGRRDEEAGLVQKAGRKFTQKELEKKFRERLRRIAGIELSVGWMRPIQVSIIGPDAERLKEIGAEVERALARIKGVTEIESSEKAASPTLAIRINRQLASDLGLTLSQIANATRPLIAGDSVTTWLGPDGQNYDVLVRLPEGRRQSIADFEQLYLQSTLTNNDGTPRMIPLRQIAEFVDTTSPKIITRMDLQRQLTLSASVEGRPQGDVGQDVSGLTKEMQLPAGYRFNVGGQTKQMIESFKYALVALGIAVIFIYLILASQFGSFLQPVAIMASLPLSLVGVFVALAVTRSTLNIFSVIGIIMLMGLVTKNAILLIDFTNQARRRGLDRVDALQEAAQVRLRPILMTTAAMIFGMMPLALGLGEGSEGNATMGRAIIGGVISSTLLTLVVVPVVYTYLDGMAAWFSSRRSRRIARREQPAAAD